MRAIRSLVNLVMGTSMRQLRAALAACAVMITVGVLAEPAYAASDPIPKGVLTNGEEFGPAVCGDGLTRTFVHPRGVATWSAEGVKWKLLRLTVTGTHVHADGSVTPVSDVLSFGESNGLGDPVDCSAPEIINVEDGVLELFVVSTIGQVRP